jgi:hypothetical protein
MEGIYELQLLDKTEHPILRAAGHAEIRDGLTIMRVNLDLTSCPPGDYRVRERRTPGGWIYGLVKLE